MLDGYSSVKKVAKKCKVQETTVTEWIRRNKIPARKQGRRWFVKDDALVVFIKNGHSMPQDHPEIDNNGGQIDIFDPEEFSGEIPLSALREPNCFSDYEDAKGGWSPIRPTKMPQQFHRRIADILEDRALYKKSYANFMRAAAYNLILDEEQRKAEENGQSPVLKAWDLAQKVIDKNNTNDGSVKAIQRAWRMLKKNGVKERIDEYVEATMNEIVGWEEPWKQRVIDILSNGEVEIDDGGDLAEKNKKEY